MRGEGLKLGVMPMSTLAGRSGMGKGWGGVGSGEELFLVMVIEGGRALRDGGGVGWSGDGGEGGGLAGDGD